MPNQLTSTGDGLSFQVTKPVPTAGLVEKDADGNTTHPAAVGADDFDDCLLVID